MNLIDFKGSDGWLEELLKRNSIVCKTNSMSGETGDVSADTVTAWKTGFWIILGIWTTWCIQHRWNGTLSLVDADAGGKKRRINNCCSLCECERGEVEAVSTSNWALGKTKMLQQRKGRILTRDLSSQKEVVGEATSVSRMG